jgi:hypothetical protein
VGVGKEKAVRTFSLFAMLIAAPALAAPANQGSSDKSAEPPAPKCLNNKSRFAGENLKAETRKLADLPAGNLSLAVGREVEGCQSVTVVRYGYGATGDTKASERNPQPLR